MAAGQYANDVVRRCVEFLRKWPNADSGPAHVVVSDFNLEDHWLDTCLASISNCRANDGRWCGKVHPVHELAATDRFLRELRAIPEAERCAGLEDGYVDA